MREFAEFDVLHAHFDQKHSHLLDQAHQSELVAADILVHLPLDLVSVCLVEVVVSHEVELILEEGKELLLTSEDVGSWDRFMRNFVRHDFGVQREDVFVLGSQVHGGHADAVHLFVREHLLLLGHGPQVVVKDLSCQEVGPYRALKASAHFDHPVHHLGPILLGHLMPLERTPSWKQRGEVASLQQLFLLQCLLDVL